MNVLYFVPHLSKEFGGTYQYAIALLKILAADRTNTYYVLNENENEDVKSIVRDLKNFHIVSVGQNGSIANWKLLINRFKKSLAARIKPMRFNIEYKSNLDFLLLRLKIDIIHSPFPSIPKSAVPTICTMHDVQELHYPAFFNSEERAKRAVRNKYSIDKAAKIVVSYNHVKQDIVKFFSKPANDVEVILLDMENLWIDKYISFSYATTVQNLSVPKKFLLYPAATWEHKNHLNLVRAVHFLKFKMATSINIICTGNQTEHFKTIERLITELDVGKNIRFLGIVDDDSLYSLYKASHGVVVPTLYEAGSFPLMESILLGKAVICSNVTSLPETIGYDDYVFDPNSIEQMGLMIQKLWQDDDFHKQNESRVRQKAKELRYNNSLIKFLNLYSAILSNQDSTRGVFKPNSDLTADTKHRIN